MNPPKPALVNKLNRLICTGRAIAADATVFEFAKEDAEGAVRFKDDALDLLMDLGATFAELRNVLNSRDPQDRRHAPGTPVLLPEKIARKRHANPSVGRLEP